MPDPYGALELWWSILGLQPGFADVVVGSPGALRFAAVTVTLAGLSEAFGESVVLFLNRVKPKHFVRSLLISALIFGFTYLFLAASVWAVAEVWTRPGVSFMEVAAVVAAAQAPRLLGFLVFLPYFGLPVSVLLWIWSLLATTLGVAELLLLGPWEAALTVSLGGLLLLTLQRTVGRPVLALARLARRRAAGQELITDRRALMQLVDTGPDAGLTVKLPAKSELPRRSRRRRRESGRMRE